MALYVSVCLLAALSALPEHDPDLHERAYPVLWGTTLGLALAHLFAFTMTSRISTTGRLTRHDGQAAFAQLLGAIGVAAVVSVAIVLLPISSEFDAARYLLAALIASLGFTAARRGGASVLHSVAFGALVLLLGFGVATLKLVLSAH